MAISRRTIKKVPRKFVKQDGGLVQYGLGGTIAGVGAIASMIPTPWTQIGGAALSMVGGVMEGFEGNKAVKEENANQLRMQGDAAQAGVYNPFRPTFAMGGVIPGMAPNVNVEGGEVIQGVDGSVAEVKGSKHSRGGVNLHMKDGGRVFSDRLINPQTGNTFAEDAEKISKMIK